MNLFRGSNHAASYSKFRPSYPAELLKTILDFLGEKHPPPYRHAVDVGCGTGQSTQYLAGSFQQVTGADVSEAQIEEANKNEKISNVTYKVGMDSSIPCDDNSVDLVTAAQAAHWFDFDKFYAEVDRILRPNGCLAIYGYTVPSIVYGDKTEAASQLLAELRAKLQGDGGFAWDERRMKNDNCYRDHKMPYPASQRVDSLHFELPVTVDWIIGYLTSWSSYQTYLKKNPTDLDFLTRQFKDKLLTALGDPEMGSNTPVTMRYPVFLLMSRKPDEG
ncbi:putative methyltransferase DDB_G0268948 isoform X3 [Lineus longissimus]|uniref:putative methyltransferase DDB_G0268948 isoform X3 n=1 Tax=Lineus longissimus TaxID=88925 RepID=UPI002B4F58DC